MSAASGDDGFPRSIKDKSMMSEMIASKPAMTLRPMPTGSIGPWVSLAPRTASATEGTKRAPQITVRARKRRPEAAPSDATAPASERCWWSRSRASSTSAPWRRLPRRGRSQRGLASVAGLGGA